MEVDLVARRFDDANQEGEYWDPSIHQRMDEPWPQLLTNVVWACIRGAWR
jgi:hypothetical protein